MVSLVAITITHACMHTATQLGLVTGLCACIYMYTAVVFSIPTASLIISYDQSCISMHTHAVFTLLCVYSGLLTIIAMQARLHVM